MTASLTQSDGVCRYATCWVPSYEMVLEPVNMLARLRPQTQGVALSPRDRTNTGGFSSTTMPELLGTAGDRPAGSSPEHKAELPIKKGWVTP